MKLLMISGDRMAAMHRQGPFVHTLQGLSQSFDRIDVICPKLPEHTQGEARLPPHVYFHPCPRGRWYQPIWILKYGRKLIALFHHDVMTVHEYPPFYNGLGAVLLRMRKKIPTVLEVHHIVGIPRSADFSEKIGALLSRIWLPFITLSVDRVRTVSKDTAERLMRWGCSRHKVVVVPAIYIDRALFQQIHVREKRYDISFCGRMVPNKGVPALLRAVARIPGCTLLLIGDGPEKTAYERMARDLDIAERTEFVGWLSTPADVLQSIATAKVFCMNSLNEGGPRVLVEAMACGMPVIATRVGIAPDILHDRENGIFTTGEPEDLVEKIGLLLADQELRTRLGHAAATVVERFDGPALLAQYAQFLRSIAS